MTTEAEIKLQVRQFYDQVGWQQVAEGVYQNARYEDLRPVSREYVHQCHLRVGRHLAPSGRFLLDAGSGPIQYPEYLQYSQGYARRVCLDISIVALREARKRIGEHGLFLVGDIAHLPFRAEVFDGVVSLHTIHHLPQDDHIAAYRQVHRVLKAGCSAVLVNGWSSSLMARMLEWPVGLQKRLAQLKKWRLRQQRTEAQTSKEAETKSERVTERKGTFVRKNTAAWLKGELRQWMPLDILVWRSVSVLILRTYIHERLGGRGVLRALFWLEERFPRFFGEHGVYPLVVVRKLA